MKRLSEKFSMDANRKKLVLNGTFIWVLFAVVYSVVFMNGTKTPWGLAVFVSFEVSAVYALLSIGIWQVCRRISIDRVPMPLLIVLHFILGIITTLLWLCIIIGLWYLAQGEMIFQIPQFWQTTWWQFFQGMLIYAIFAGLYYTVIYYKQYREKELRESELSLLTRDAELKALKMQINPHFLFNSLNSINALVTQNPNQARDMIARLSELLRLSLDSRDNALVPLIDELTFARLYLEIESIRFGDRIEGHEDIDMDLMQVSFPSMILQPLLENAVKHGIGNHRGKGKIHISIHKKEEWVECVIENSLGVESQAGEKLASSGTGLKNIQQRLALIYQEKFIFETGDLGAGLYRATVRIPWRIHGSD